MVTTEGFFTMSRDFISRVEMWRDILRGSRLSRGEAPTPIKKYFLDRMTPELRKEVVGMQREAQEIVRSFEMLPHAMDFRSHFCAECGKFVGFAIGDNGSRVIRGALLCPRHQFNPEGISLYFFGYDRPRYAYRGCGALLVTGDEGSPFCCDLWMGHPGRHSCDDFKVSWEASFIGKTLSPPEEGSR
jgi:hypothetical protein